MKILLLGGSGILGQELQKINPNILAPTHNELAIENFNQVVAYFEMLKPDIVINAAAETDNRKVEKLPEKAIETNIIGSANIARACLTLNIRLVYLSTDYIYKGDRGNYKEADEILPFNLYSWTKLGGECSAVAVKNHLIIRTSFGKQFEYKEAFVDKWFSKDYVSTIAPMIYEAALSPLTGVLNIGTERKTPYEHANSADVKPIKLQDSNYFTPYDTSLNLQKWKDYKSSKAIAKPHSECRICGNKNLTKYLDLGLMPLANNLEFTAVRAKDKERFPLQVLFCEDCGLSQLSVVIDPSKMFSYYTYRSSVNKGYVIHCREMANDMKKYVSKESFMIDIAGNDGSLLKEFKEEIGLNTLNVDPASNLTAIAESIGIESITDFWNEDLAAKIKSTHGETDLITATNVFAHVDDIKGFIKACKESLKTDGVLVLEFPYLVDFIENMEFDTVYFEHLSYFSILPLMRLASLSGMKIINIKKFNIHGGTVRVMLAKEESAHTIEESVSKFVKHELSEGFDKVDKYLQWNLKVDKSIKDFGLSILELKRKGNRIAAFAASAKGNTLLNCSLMNTDIIEFIADETPEKIGKFSPGTGIPIVNKQMIERNPPDYIIILSWNFKDEIIAKLNKIYKGTYIIPIPELSYIKSWTL